MCPKCAPCIGWKVGQTFHYCQQGLQNLSRDETDGEAVFSGCELFGFHTGTFEYKIVRGTNKRDVNGIAWKVNSDLDLVLHEKKPVRVCKFLHTAAVNHCIAEVAISEHSLSPKLQHPSVHRLHIIFEFVSEQHPNFRKFANTFCAHSRCFVAKYSRTAIG